MTFENICRTCLRMPKTLLSLVGKEEFLNKIEVISCVKIQSNDKLPLWICQECIENVNKSFNFRKVIINSDIKLRERYAVLKPEKNPPEENFCDENNDKDSNSDFCLVSNESIFDEDDGPNKPITDKPFDEEEKKNEGSCVQPKLCESTEKSYVCTQCEYECTELSEWNIHKKSHVKTRVCNFCGRTIRADNFSKHITSHSGEPVKCPYCNKMFKNSVSIKDHIKRHKPENLKCEICGKNFLYRIYYNRHKRRHIDDERRKGACEICGKILANKNRMKSHMRAHTGERPYLCEFCNKGFKSRYARNVHRRQHTKEKPYQCKYCSAAFPVKVSLSRHVESKHKNNTESS